MTKILPPEFDGEIDAFVGGFRVVGSYVVLSHGDTSIRYVAAVEADAIEIKLMFTKDAKQKDIAVQIDERENTIHFLIPSAIKEFTIGATKPMKIGSVATKSVYATIKCLDFGESLRSIYTTFYVDYHDHAN